MEARLLNGTAEQYHALDEAIRTAQFVRNIPVRYWMDNRSVNKAVLYAYRQDLAKEFDFVRKLDPWDWNEGRDTVLISPRDVVEVSISRSGV